MGDDILDYLTSNWQNLLGIGGPTVPPAPPPNQNSGPSFSPSGVMDTNALTGSPMGVPGAPATTPPTYDPMSGLPMTGSPGIPSAPSGPGIGPAIAASLPAAMGAGGFAPPPNPPQPGMGGGPMAGAPTPPPGPPMGGGPMAGAPQPGMGGGPFAGIPTSTGPTPGPPLNIAPPTATTGSLAGALGLPPGYEGATATPANRFANGAFGTPAPAPGAAVPGGWGGALTAGLAGLGRGLSAVGSLRPGATAGAAFGAGAGGALTGGMNEINLQQQQFRQAKNDLFTQSSTAFRDMIAAQTAEDQTAYRKAQGAYLQSRANSINLGGSGTSAWQNTPYGKTIQVENEAQKYEKGQQIILQKRWAMNGTPPDEQQKDLERLNQNVESYRQRLYKQAGVDPNKAEKLKTMGTSEDNPFDTKGMTLEQFHSQVPMGAWYTDQNGVTRQRTVPPPGGQAPSAAAATPTTADYMAMEQQPTGAIQ